MSGICNICHKNGAKYYGSDPYEPGWEYWYCDQCIKMVIDTSGKQPKEVKYNG